jgi:hypothetical protein
MHGDGGELLPLPDLRLCLPQMHKPQSLLFLSCLSVSLDHNTHCSVCPTLFFPSNIATLCHAVTCKHWWHFHQYRHRCWYKLFANAVEETAEGSVKTGNFHLAMIPHLCMHIQAFLFQACVSKYMGCVHAYGWTHIETCVIHKSLCIDTDTIIYTYQIQSH